MMMMNKYVAIANLTIISISISKIFIYGWIGGRGPSKLYSLIRNDYPPYPSYSGISKSNSWKVMAPSASFPPLSVGFGHQGIRGGLNSLEEEKKDTRITLLHKLKVHVV